MLSDIEIAQSAKIKPIAEVAEQAGIDPDKLEFYGKYKAKLPLNYIQNLPERPDAKLILVTAMNPTPAGEGKTTVSIGLAQGLKLVGKNPILALREPCTGTQECFRQAQGRPSYKEADQGICSKRRQCKDR